MTIKSRTSLAWQLYLLTGFVAGFVCAFVILFHISSINRSVSTRNSAVSMKFEHLQKEFQLKVASVRVLCMVLTCPEYVERFAQHVNATWGKRCSKLVFVSSENYKPLGVVQVVEPEMDSYHDLWNKTREGFRHVWQEYGQDYDWFLKADDDTYVIMENLHHMLSAYDANVPLYFGHQLRIQNVNYMSGGASYVLSREALRRFVEQAYGSHKICPKPDKIGVEDFSMGICLQNVGVHLIDSTRAMTNDDKEKFFPLDIESYLYNSKSALPAWLREMSVSDVNTGPNCCSIYSVAFHYIKPDRMYLFEFFLYRLRVFGRKYVERFPKRWTLSELLEMFPLQNNSKKPFMPVKL
ncbi:hypothetical protein KR093_010482 [Drosophila rubida]|uniref:N-acetylgalactosaminide beta-1,3-galactosyltransferase n=1 Tax=Drosophila rubida TaxID=30044 RepID=A0AAD4K684_9MUSC|nr:hypothetical protein KR093_010482 [Drosophila rubida]